MEKFRTLLNVIQNYIEVGNGLTNNQAKTIWNTLSDAITEREQTESKHQSNCNLPDVRKMLPIKATHCMLGNVIIIGVRIECSENNNLMYFCKFEDKTLGWVYDYDIKV